MNAITALFRALRRDMRRWQNGRKRSRMVVYTWPHKDQRDWQRDWEDQERPAILRRQAW